MPWVVDVSRWLGFDDLMSRRLERGKASTRNDDCSYVYEIDRAHTPPIAGGWHTFVFGVRAVRVRYHKIYNTVKGVVGGVTHSLQT